MQWASVVEEVLDLLHIEECSVMAHSAGAPYALSFSNKLHKRIRGDICLLAPWVGGSESGAPSSLGCHVCLILSHRRLQMAQVRPEWLTQDCAGSGMEATGLDDWQTSYYRL